MSRINRMKQQLQNLRDRHQRPESVIGGTERKTRLSKRFLSIVLCLALLMSYTPVWVMAASASSDRIDRVADPSTMDGWRDYFLPDGKISTQNAGGVWMDKSVFTDDNAFDRNGITMDNPDAFLVALSAMATNMSVTGMSTMPTDSMLVLDVSGSMNEGDNDVAEELVEAANASIKALLENNRYNRVGVVLYSGSSNSSSNYTTGAVVLLPLGRYTTGADGKYLNYTRDVDGFLFFQTVTESVSLDADLRIEGTTTAPTAVSKEVVGATYIQRGIITAMNQFLAEDNAVMVDGVQRKPVMVLMSDGAPSLGSTNFTNPGYNQEDGYNLGSGSGTSAALGFVTQLSAAYAKAKIEEKYGTDALFYTLGLGLSDSDTVALSVMDPDNENASVAVDDFWNDVQTNNANQVTFEGYNHLEVGQSVSVGDDYSVTKIATPLEQNYVDKFFNASGSTGNLAAELEQAFSDIVGEINLQSQYIPTLISPSGENHSGFVSFVDKVGEYMEVTDIKGILINNTLYSGADLASNFVPSGGNLGTFDRPTALGHEMVAAVRQRIGLGSDDEARTLIGLAYEYGQIRYNNANDYSNYIGWYADGDNNFLGFYQEGVTHITDPNAVYTIKSYGYLGVEHDSNMMYATVQVRHNIKTGEETVAFAVPAALIPVMTYDVSLDENGNLLDIELTGSESPIRLVYEVALDDHINEWNVKEIVPAEYLADEHNINQDGSVNFYTNDWEHTNETGYNTVNTYGYFNPSRQNDKYYFTFDAPVCTDTNGTLYTGAAEPNKNGTFYRGYTVYEENGATRTKKTVYRQLSVEALETAMRIAGTNNWYIPSGNVHVDLAGDTVYKRAPVASGTLTVVNQPFVDITGHHVDDTDHLFYVGATLGNNGKLTLKPQTGIKLSKTLAAGATATNDAFEFVLTKGTATESTHDALLVDADGTETPTSVSFDANGVETVEIQAGQTLYIGDVTPGETITIEETATAGYLPSVTVNGVASANPATVTAVNNQLINVAFVNAERGTGNLTIAKEIEHELGVNYQIPADRRFTMLVTLSGIGTANATFDVEHTNGTYTEITTDANGRFTIGLAHGEQFEIFGLPAGTEATVVETGHGDAFTPAYWDNGVLGDGKVTVARNSTVSVIVVNDYEITNAVDPVNITVTGNKQLVGTTWQDNYSFDFRLEKLLSGNNWQPLGTATASAESPAFDFNGALVNERYGAPGTYYYRIVEVVPERPLGGFAYDKTVHSFAVHVGDTNMDGQLEITEVVSDRPNTTAVAQTASGWNVNANFTNTYSVRGSATVTIDVNKTITNIGGAEKTLAGYPFGLFDAVTGQQVGNALTTTERGFARFVLTYDADEMNASEETFRYVLKEIAPNPMPTGWTYSTVEVPITVKVRDTGSGTISAVIYTGQEEPANAGTSISATFTNEYDPVDATLPVDFVKKQIVGRDFRSDDNFVFQLVETNLPQGATPRTLNGTLTSDDDNDRIVNINFGTLTFDKVGTYHFEVKEIGQDGRGVTVDTTTYLIVVTVTDANGRLHASYDVVNATGNTIVFQNTYEAAETTYAISGTKTLTGRDLLNDEFTFILTEALNAQGEIAQGAKVYETHNEYGGLFTFPEITYTEAGTYYYVVSEKQNGGSSYGIKYDGGKHVVAVTVTDDTATGKLVATANLDADDIVFNNRYVPNPVSHSIDGQKLLSGMTLADGQFAFELWQSNDEWTFVNAAPLQTVKNNAAGNIAFGLVDYENSNAAEFTKVGTYYYLVKEVSGGETINGVTYDAVVYRVRVNITDDLLGQLHATVHIYDEAGVPQAEVLFNNSYEADSAIVTIDGTKVLQNRDLVADEFKFFLYSTDENFAVNEQIPAKEAKNKADGSFAFDALTFEEAGTYYFVVKEDAATTAERVTNDTSVYHVVIEIGDDGEGKLYEVSRVITKAGSDAAVEEVEEIVFTNVYMPVPAPEPTPDPVFPDSPKTGDSTHFRLWLTLLFVSGGGVLATTLYSKKKEETIE